jgi:HEXXH motif-containing protein
VAALVRVVHILEAPGFGHDVSYSDPQLPFSVFVSVPVHEIDAGLRVAESILHEAMHLQLTLIELAEPLVAEQVTVGFSPWQQQDRPVGGLLHGLYVFRVIYEFLGCLFMCRALSDESHRYISKRRDQIADEIAQVRGLAGAEGLTERGRRLSRYLLSGYPAGEAR